MKIINAIRHKGASSEEAATLHLTTRALREDKTRGAVQMSVKLTAIRAAVLVGENTVYGTWVDGADLQEPGMDLRFNVSERVIGCCTFSKSAFTTILKAAKAK